MTTRPNFKENFIRLFSGYLGPGGLAEDGKFMNSKCIGGAAGYIDRWMFGEDHIYGYPTAKVKYFRINSPLLAASPVGPPSVMTQLKGSLHLGVPASRMRNVFDMANSCFKIKSAIFGKRIN